MMNDPQAPEISEPFEPQPADLGGCGKPAVFGCLVILGLLAIGLVVFLVKAKDMLDWALLRYQDVVVENLSEEVSAAERQRLELAFEGAREAIRDNRMDPAALQELQRFMSSPPGRSQMGVETVRELTAVLEALAGSSAEPSPKQPAKERPASRTAAIRYARL